MRRNRYGMFSKGDLRVDVFQKCTRKNAKIVGTHCSLMTYLRSSTCLSNFLSGVLTAQRLERKTALVSQQITHLWYSWPRLLHKGQRDSCCDFTFFFNKNTNGTRNSSSFPLSVSNYLAESWKDISVFLSFAFICHPKDCVHCLVMWNTSGVGIPGKYVDQVMK